MTIHTEVSAGLHPDNVKSLPNYERNKGYVNGLIESLSVAYEGLASVHKARLAAAKNPTMNSAGRLIIVGKFAERQQTVVSKKIDKTMADLDKAIQATEDMLTTPLTASAGTGTVPSEIRSYAKGLTVAKRQQFLSDAEAAGDLTTLQAILAAPAYLSGITEQEKAVRTKMYHEHNSPETASRLKTMTAGKELLTERSALIFGEFEKAIGASWMDVAEVRNAKSQSDAAFAIEGV